MSMKRARPCDCALWAVLLVAPFVACGPVAPLPARPSALVTVSTDLPVPRAVGRVRVDVFSADGVWRESRDYARAEFSQWPFSFGVYSERQEETEVLVRIRAYPEGATRDYLGERYEAPDAYTPWQAPTSLAALCEGAQPLPMGQTVELRRGRIPIRGAEALDSDACILPTLTGGTAARITIPDEDDYRFEVVDTVPGGELASADTTLFLRRDCLSRPSEVACNDNIENTPGRLNVLSRLLVHLEPGELTLLSGGGLSSSPATLFVHWNRASAFDATPTPKPRELPPRGLELEVAGGGTPRTEPYPTGAVDRLMRVKLVPGAQRKVTANLLGSCAGSMAELVVRDGKVVLAASRSCSSRGAHELLVPETGDDRLAQVGSYGESSCSDAASPVPGADAVCVPGGAFLLGLPSSTRLFTDGISASNALPTSPGRLARLPRFWLDRTEYTVGRYRAALRAGFRVPPHDEPVVNDGPLVPGATNAQAATYSTQDRGRDALPFNGVNWTLAQALCEHAGGSLPTAAEWEYAALAAGRAIKATFPWGEAEPTCDAFVGSQTAPAICPLLGPQPASLEGKGDVNALGIVGLGGNLAEWLYDATKSYTASCWQETARGPMCFEPDAPLREHRGGDYRIAFFLSRGTERLPRPMAARSTSVGFRCAYAEAVP
jgi:formylglycine-generating enzyme required for sulfatase activity